SVQLPEAVSIVGCQTIDLGRREPRGDRSHSPIDVIAAVTGGIHLQLQDEVIPTLLGQNGGLDGAAGAGPVARRAGWDVAAGIAPLDQAPDGPPGLRRRPPAPLSPPPRPLTSR